MPEAVIGNVAGAVVGGLMGGDSQGGTQTMSKEPWAEAAPWLKQQIATGQNLQNYYQANPFNALQQAAYGNLFRQGDYMNQAVPGLLAQMSQSQGFDRNNPMAKPAAYRFPQMGLMGQGASGSMGGGQMSGLLGNMNTSQNPFMNGGVPAPAAPAVAAPAGPPINNTSGAYFQSPGSTAWTLGYDRDMYGAAGA